MTPCTTDHQHQKARHPSPTANRPPPCHQPGPKFHSLGALGSLSRTGTTTGTALRTSFLGSSWTLCSESSCHHARATTGASACVLGFPQSRVYTVEAQKTSSQGQLLLETNVPLLTGSLACAISVSETEERKCYNSETRTQLGSPETHRAPGQVQGPAPGSAARSILEGRRPRRRASGPSILTYGISCLLRCNVGRKASWHPVVCVLQEVDAGVKLAKQ